MARYTLKTFCNTTPLEVFEHRAVGKLNGILIHPRHHMAGQTDPWGEPLNAANRFEIYDSVRMKLFDGNITEALAFTKGLR